MITFEETENALEEISLTVPSEFYKHLNGGIILLEEDKLHPQNIGGDLFTLGEYCVNSLGRSIKIYYGSFVIVYGHLPMESFKERLKSTLFHEFTHHLESLAGEKGLEVKDEINIKKYIDKKTPI